MHTHEALWKHVEEQQLCPGVDTLSAWLDVDWLTIRVGRRMVPVFPAWGLRDALLVHDVHHVLTGYDTSLAGEAELAAWELGSGGCRWNMIFWLDRTVVLIAAMLLMPRRALRALRHGLACRNLYGRQRNELLATDFDALRRAVDPTGKRYL